MEIQWPSRLRQWKNTRQDAQKVRPARPQRVKARGGTHRTLWGRSPLEWILANGKAPTVLPASEKLLLNVEGLNDARTPLAGFFSILLRFFLPEEERSIQSRDGNGDEFDRQQQSAYNGVPGGGS